LRPSDPWWWPCPHFLSGLPNPKAKEEKQATELQKHLRDQPKPHRHPHAESQTRQASEKRGEFGTWERTHRSEAALAAAAMATTMTAKRGPSGGEMRGSGGRARACPVGDGEMGHPAAAALRASLSTRDQVRAYGVCLRLRLRARVFAMPSPAYVEDWSDDGFAWYGLVACGAHAC